MRAKSPIPLSEVLEYVRLEEGGEVADRLVPGSVKYVGAHSAGDTAIHFWSYPSTDRVMWVTLESECLGFPESVPQEIRGRTESFADHKRKTVPKPPKAPWVGSNRPMGSHPQWVPTVRIRMHDLSMVAMFKGDFAKICQTFSATPSRDKTGGGAGPVNFFFLEIASNRLAMIEQWERSPTVIELSLHVSHTGRVDWEDYDQIMDALDVPLSRAFRQGGLVWRYRKPTPEKTAKVQDHYTKIWMPRGEV